MSDEQPGEVFWEIHSGLPREGPGDDASTRAAYEAAAPGLPPHPRILDVACGPGMQTMELARISDGPITALDFHQPFLDELERRAREAGVLDRITLVNASMYDMPFPDGSFDLIWCEGAMYMTGFEEALRAWKRLLPDGGGYIVATEPCWLAADIPDDVRALWAEYPGMGTVTEALERAERAGYGCVKHFTIPQSSWWDDYYKPLSEKLPAIRAKYAGDASASAVVEDSQHEVDMFRTHGHLYGYVFFVMRTVMDADDSTGVRDTMTI